MCTSSTEPSDESDVDDAEALGESFGVPAVEFEVVEGIEYILVSRLSAISCGRAVLLILEGRYTADHDKSFYAYTAVNSVSAALVGSCNRTN